MLNAIDEEVKLSHESCALQFKPQTLNPKLQTPNADIPNRCWDLGFMI